jgi:replicative DNA helicase
MAVDNEARLISKVIRDRSISSVLQHNIGDDWFLDEINRAVWVFIREHYSRYREVPTGVAVKDNFPNYRLFDVEDSIDYLIDQMVAFRRRMKTREGLEVALTNLTSNDHEAALIAMEKAVSVVNSEGVPGTNETDLTVSPDDRFQDYLDLGSNTFLGIPTGFEKMDEATAGLQKGQLVTLIAPPKTGKSQIALQMAVNCHEQDFTVMFQSFEMNNREQQQRHDAMRSKISHNRLRRGKLTTSEEGRFKKMLSTMALKKPFHLVDAVNGLTVSSLSAKIDQLKPDVVFVDGVYLMLDEVTGDMNTPQAITNITRGLKRLAQRMDIPVVITTQTLLWKMKGGKVSADSIGYSSSFFQDSDVIFGLEPIEEDEEVRVLKIVASRNCGPSETTLTWRWETGCFHEESLMAKCPECSSSFSGTTW